MLGVHGAQGVPANTAKSRDISKSLRSDRRIPDNDELEIDDELRIDDELKIDDESSISDELTIDTNCGIDEGLTIVDEFENPREGSERTTTRQNDTMNRSVREQQCDRTTRIRECERTTIQGRPTVQENNATPLVNFGG